MRSGKVREGFDLGDTLPFVATDRISVLDVILLDPIPKKGAVLKTKPLPVRELGRDKVIGDLFKVLKPKCREVILRARARNL
jgi:hypothetical protein